MFIPDSLRDRLGGNLHVIGMVAAPVAWLGLSALFGTIQLSDLFAAAVLVVIFGLNARRKKAPDDDPERGIYGPRE